MTQAIFDTNIIIDYINGIFVAKDVIDFYDYGLVSIITAIEVRVGIRGATVLATEARSILDQFKTVSMSDDIVEQTILIRQNYRLKLPDAIIWETAQSLQVPLVTRNTKDFKSDWENIHIPYTFQQNKGM